MKTEDYTDWTICTNTFNSIDQHQSHLRNFTNLLHTTEENSKDTLTWIIQELNRRLSYCMSLDMSYPHVIIVEKSIDHLINLLESLYHSGSLSRTLFNTFVQLIKNIDDNLISDNWTYRSIHIRKNETKSAELAIKQIPNVSLSSFKRFYRYYNSTCMSILEHYYYINADLYTPTELMHELLDKIECLRKTYCLPVGEMQPNP
jgi:hypothetical protein